MLFISETIGHDSSFLVIFISVWAQSFEKNGKRDIYNIEYCIRKAGYSQGDINL
jgi:hypothetical protein